MRLSVRTVVVAAVAVVMLTAASTLAWAAASGAINGGATPPIGTCSAPTLAGSTVDARLIDMGGMMGGHGMMGRNVGGGPMRVLLSASEVSAGTVSFRAFNTGSLVHELVILPIAAGGSVGSRAVGPDGAVDETGGVGEASRSCAAGAGDGIASGAAGWVTVHLAPGRYEVICNEPGHYAAGMYAGLSVH